MAPTAPEIEAATSAPVEAMTRAVNVEAFMPCSAAETKYASTALYVLGVRLAAPADHEALDHRARLVDAVLRDHRQAEPAGGLRDERHRHHGDVGEVLAGLVIIDVEQGLQPPGRREGGDGGLDVDADVAGVDRDRERLRRRQPRVELGVDQQAPHLAVRHPTDEVLDVHPAVAQGAAFAVGLGDLRLEGDDTLEPWDELRHGHAPSCAPPSGVSSRGARRFGTAYRPHPAALDWERMAGVTNVAPGASGPALDLAALRSTYADHGLPESEVLADPLAQLERWLADGGRGRDPRTERDGGGHRRRRRHPSARIVLLKGLDASGVTFFTNLSSRKGQAIAHEPRVALVLPWHAIGRQVRLEGTASPVSREETQEYFDTRPYGSQIGAWASPQSEVVTDRAELERRWESAAARFPIGSRVPAPAHWGGLRVVPDVVEFWQGRPDRMHDRLRYRRRTPPGPSSGWLRDRTFCRGHRGRHTTAGLQELPQALDRDERLGRRSADDRRCRRHPGVRHHGIVVRRRHDRRLRTRTAHHLRALWRCDR